MQAIQEGHRTHIKSAGQHSKNEAENTPSITTKRPGTIHNVVPFLPLHAVLTSGQNYKDG